MPSGDTIAAIATAPGRGAVGVVRVSGPAVAPIAQAICGGRVLAPRVATLTSFLDEHGEAIDEGFALFFPAPRSYTGEDVLELQGHGGPVVLGRVLQRCVALGARVAEPGEFTRRAFLNDKLDLAQAESVADLIDAASTAAARSAVRSLQGAFSKEIAELDRAITDLRMLVEATLDFPEEEEIDSLEAYGAVGQLADVRSRLSNVLAMAQQGRLLREGVHVALVGRPNVGKSSLLNRLAGEEIAIVTDIPGTTRDALRVSIALEGVPFHVSDTAGIRESEDVVERIGVERSRRVASEADVALVVVEAGGDEEAHAEAIAREVAMPGHRIVVANKIDLVRQAPGTEDHGDVTIVRVSATEGAGLDLLRQALLRAAGWTDRREEGVFMARARHLEALRETAAHLDQAARIGPEQPDLFAEELRYAQQALGSIVGAKTADDLLGEIFARFCIGK
jgi:tRNA modification GTPase